MKKRKGNEVSRLRNARLEVVFVDGFTYWRVFLHSFTRNVMKLLLFVEFVKIIISSSAKMRLIFPGKKDEIQDPFDSGRSSS